jgi:SAM-dependent methyltransferase
MNPSAWLQRWIDLIPSGGRVLDVACGGGRNTRYLAERGYLVTAVDRDLGQSKCVHATPGVTWLQHDLETGEWPFAAGIWQGIVVVNYLHRPLMPHLIAGLANGGALIYATFAHGQQRYGRPRNPEHLLMPGELLEMARGRLHVVAYEDVEEAAPVPCRRQRLAALKP